MTSYTREERELLKRQEFETNRVRGAVNATVALDTLSWLTGPPFVLQRQEQRALIAFAQVTFSVELTFYSGCLVVQTYYNHGKEV